jgi:hypothetical protein
VITEKSDITTSYLLIQRAKSKDSGIYTCEPSNAKFSNITVHILNGNYLIMFQKEVPWEVLMGGNLWIKTRKKKFFFVMRKHIKS